MHLLVEHGNTELIDIHSNTIYHSFIDTEESVGIYVQDCDGATIAHNEIAGNCSSCTDPLIGIYTYSSTGVLLGENTIENEFYGVLVRNDATAGNAVCNAITDCVRGFGFHTVANGDYGPVAAVGTSDEPSDNAWFASSGTQNRTYTLGNTDGSTFTWIYRCAGSTPAPGSEHDAEESPPSIFHDEAPGSILIAPTCTTIVASLCGSTERFNGDDTTRASLHLPPPVVDLMDSVLHADPHDMPYLVYSYLDLANLVGSADSIVDRLLPYTNVEQHRIAKNYLLRDEFDSANYILNSISPINVAEHLSRRVLALYLKIRSQCEDSLCLTGDERDFLDSLISIRHGGLGDARSMAISLLDTLDIEIEIDSESKLEFDRRYTLQLTSNPVVTPGFLRVRAPHPIERISVFAALGIPVVYEFSASGVESLLDLSGLAPGIYLVTCTMNNGAHASEKLIVTR